MFAIRHAWYNAFVNLQCIIKCCSEIMKSLPVWPTVPFEAAILFAQMMYWSCDTFILDIWQLFLHLYGQLDLNNNTDAQQVWLLTNIENKYKFTNLSKRQWTSNKDRQFRLKPPYYLHRWCIGHVTPLY
jgi:hypothetical protein